jgi:hypothetical protein
MSATNCDSDMPTVNEAAEVRLKRVKSCANSWPLLQFIDVAWADCMSLFINQLPPQMQTAVVLMF